MLPRLVLNPGRPDEQIFHLKPTVTTIGRTRDNDIAVLHRSLSRRHARIEMDGERVALVDLGSKNGTLLGGARVARCELRLGDTFQCGELSFRLVSETTDNLTIAPATISAPSAGSFSGPGSAPATRRDSTEPPERVRDKLDIMIEASKLLVGGFAVDAVLREIVQLAYEILDVDCVALVLLDESTGNLRAAALRGDAEGAGYDKRFVAHVLSSGRSERIADAGTDDRFRTADRAGVRSAMGAPIFRAGRAAGVLYADHREAPDHFAEGDLALLEALANHAGAALARPPS